MKTEKKSFLNALFAYAGSEKKKMIGSVILSVLSVSAGLVPFYCMYELICLFVADAATVGLALQWCLLALAAYAVKILTFTISTAMSHSMAYTILEKLRLRLADRILHAPLGNVENHTIGEIKSMMVDKIENLEPPLAHMIPEGAGHIVLPIVSIAALCVLDWRLALASLVTFPLSLVCMMLTFQISGESFSKYDESASYMNSTIVEYIEGIEVIKAFGRAGVSYEKYADAITDFRTFVIQWLTSTFATMKLSFALFPSTLLGTLPVALALANGGSITAAQAALAVVLSISMVGSLAKLEVFSENMRQVKFTVENLEEFLDMPELPEPKGRAEVTHTDDTVIGEGGGTLSGGEKQRVSIARAILKNAPIIILDEATASIDPENEHLIQQALSELMRGKTVITIAHRLATIEQANQILVIDDGKVVQQGTHAELASIPGKYKEFIDIRKKSEGWNITE